MGKVFSSYQFWTVFVAALGVAAAWLALPFISCHFQAGCHGTPTVPDSASPPLPSGASSQLSSLHVKSSASSTADEQSYKGAWSGLYLCKDSPSLPVSVDINEVQFGHVTGSMSFIVTDQSRRDSFPQGATAVDGLLENEGHVLILTPDIPPDRPLYPAKFSLSLSSDGDGGRLSGDVTQGQTCTGAHIILSKK